MKKIIFFTLLCNVKHLFFFLALIIGCTPAMAATSPASAGRPGQAAALASKTVALINPDSDGAYCSGVWISSNAILTAQHCIDGDKVGDVELYVVQSDVYPDGSAEPKDSVIGRVAKLVAQDKGHDLALLQAEAPPDHMSAALASNVRQGDYAQTMGQSLGLLWWSYSNGTVAAVRVLDLGLGPVKWVQTTTPTSPGNSGGGLFDEYGDLIGICHGYFPRGENLNIFVHPDHIRTFLGLS